MKMKFLMSFMLSLMILNIYAQKDVYLDNSLKYTIKTATLDCINLGISSLPKNDFVPSISIGYFRELRIYNTMNICINTEIKNIQTKRTDYIITGESDSNGKNVPVNAIHAFFSIEPRWYFSYKNRFLNNKKTTLNTGWYISSPISYESGLLNNIYPDFSLYGYSFHVSDAILTGNYMAFSPQIGFRYAMFQKIILEASVKYSIQVYSSNKHMMESSNKPYLNFKVGYCL